MTAEELIYSLSLALLSSPVRFVQVNVELPRPRQSCVSSFLLDVLVSLTSTQVMEIRLSALHPIGFRLFSLT